MKILNWIYKYKYPLMVTAFFIVVIICLYLFIQSLKKDHSLDMVKFQLKTLEEERIKEVAIRKPLLDIIDVKNNEIADLKKKDIETQAAIMNLESRIDNLPKQYNEKAKAINNFSDADLQQYFNSLPVQPDNDY